MTTPTKESKQEKILQEFDEKFGKYEYLCRGMNDFTKGEWKNIKEVRLFLVSSLTAQKEKMVEMCEEEKKALEVKLLPLTTEYDREYRVWRAGNQTLERKELLISYETGVKGDAMLRYSSKIEALDDLKRRVEGI